MDRVSNTAIDGYYALVGFGEIFIFAFAIIILTAVVLSMFGPPPRLRKHPRPFPAGDDVSHSSCSSAAADSVAVSPAAIVGSDYYVPTSDELTGEIKTHILDRQKREALQLSRELVSEYRRRLENGELTDVYCEIANPLAADFTVMRLCEEVLKPRGWSASWNGRGTVFFGPTGGGARCSFSKAELNTIPDSQSLAELIESNIIAPRKALALRVAKELVDGYRVKLEAEQPTSEGITVTLAERIDYDVLIAVENILAPRGWSVTQREGSSYSLWPTEKRDKPYRGGPFMLL